jgi:transcriptional regulator with XRE-family HTH domain
MGAEMKNTNSLLEAMDAARPDVAEELRANAFKAKLASDLRRRRKQAGLTQQEISEISGLTQPMVSRLESPLGNMPNIMTLVRYIQACGSHLAIADFAAGELQAEGFVLVGETELDEEVAAV